LSTFKKSLKVKAKRETKKEGKTRVVAEISDIWDGVSKDIVLLDNNIFALPNHFEKIYKQLLINKLRVDFNQGLDIRLLNHNNAEMLSNLRHKEYHFAWDNVKDEQSIRHGIALLKCNNIKRSTFYILVGYDSTYKEDLYRANVLKGLGQNGFIQRFNYTKDKILSIIARWVNQHHVFQKMTFKEFIMHPKHKKGYYKICMEAGLL